MITPGSFMEWSVEDERKTLFETLQGGGLAAAILLKSEVHEAFCGTDFYVRCTVFRRRYKECCLEL